MKSQRIEEMHRIVEQLKPKVPSISRNEVLSGEEL